MGMSRGRSKVVLAARSPRKQSRGGAYDRSVADWIPRRVASDGIVTSAPVEHQGPAVPTPCPAMPNCRWPKTRTNRWSPDSAFPAPEPR